MPKDKRRNRRHQQPDAEEEDNVSMCSDVTNSTLHNVSDEEPTVSEEEQYEAKVKEAIDLATEKSVHTRVNALTALKTAFQKRVMAGFLLDHYQTLVDIIERSIKKGRGTEQIAASKLASVLVMSLLGTTEAETVYKTLRPLLSYTLLDNSVSPQARQEIARSIAFTAFLACPDTSELSLTLNDLHSAFCKAVPKGNGELPTLSSAEVSLHVALLQGVCLLMTLLGYGEVYLMAGKFIEELFPILSSQDTEMRMVVGEAMALLYESSRLHDEGFRWKKHNMLVSKLSELVNESHKNFNKKDKKMQKSLMREVVLTLEEAVPFSESISIGPSRYKQELLLDTWSLRFQYQAMCHAMEQGLDHHMTYNAALRECYNLGKPPVPADFIHKPNEKKPNRQTPEVKARFLARNKCRDNRAAALMYDD